MHYDPTMVLHIGSTDDTVSIIALCNFSVVLLTAVAVWMYRYRVFYECLACTIALFVYERSCTLWNCM